MGIKETAGTNLWLSEKGGSSVMRLDGFGLLVEDMARMIRFYRDVLGFEIKESVLGINLLKRRMQGRIRWHQRKSIWILSWNSFLGLMKSVIGR